MLGGTHPKGHFQSQGIHQLTNFFVIGHSSSALQQTVTLAKSPEKVARTTVSRRLRSASAREISIRITRARA